MIKYSTINRPAILFIVFIAVALSSCKHTPIIPESPAISFKSEVQPIITGNCAMSGCHNGVGGDEHFALLTYDDVMNNGEVNPFNADNSKLYQVLTGSGEEAMPPTGQLNNDQIKLIYVWIMQGAKNN